MTDQKQKKFAEKYRTFFDDNKEKIDADFFSFLKFKSISADPSYKQEILNCAKWVAEYLEQSGFTVSYWKTSVNPVVFASHQASSSSRPTLLFYHHYDVQPVDPIDLWKSDPFDPLLKDGEIYARGASDNKGQCYYTLVALRAFLEIGKKNDLNIKVLIDGEEEIGSHGLFEILNTKEQELKSDYTLIVDLSIPSLKKPAVTVGFRGIVTFDITCTGSNSDLHSGQFGGIAYNPLRALAELISSIWDENGHIKIDHFYDGIQPIDTEQLMDVDLSEMIDRFEISPLYFEKGFTQLESNWLRPTCEINGLSGGYSGPGFKTVIPSKGFCKLSCRLVPGQDPDLIQKNVVNFLKKHIANGFHLDIKLGHGAPAFYGSAVTSFVNLVKKAYEGALGVQAGVCMAGGSLPIATSLARVSKGQTLGMGFAFDDDYIHAPNEHFGMDRLKYGMVTIGTLLELLAEEK